jgi:mannosyltransferase
MATREQAVRGAGAPDATLSAAREFVSRHSLLMIVALGAVVRFATLGLPAYWLDEAITVHETHDGFAGVIHGLRTVEGGPPLYLSVIWAWQKVFGGSEIAVRSLSALLGTATVPIVYAAARELASRRAGLIAAALTATSPLLIWYSQEVRPYSLLVFLSALTLLYFIRALQREEPRWVWGWAIASALALATHYFALALIAPEAIWLLLRARAGRVRVLWAYAIIGAVGIALIPLLAEQEGRADYIRLLDRSDRLLALPQHFVVGLSVPGKAVPVLVGCVVVVTVVYALIRADQPCRHAFALASGIGAAGMLLALGPMLLGFVITRYVIELWLPFALAVAVALGVRAVGGLGLGVVVALCAVGVGLSMWNATTPAAQRVNWDDVAHALGQPRQERVVGAPGALVGYPLTLYLDGAQLANKDDRLVASELALLWMRPVANYGIGPCVWGAICGGKGLGGPAPPFKAPRQFKLVRSGSTPRVTYRIYRAKTPVRLPSPEPGQVVLIQQPP